MVYNLKFSRFEDQPWGFRLSGGSDFEIPLTVIKVTAGGIAESLGMQVGDIVVRVNETPTSNLNHDAAHEVIVGCGNNFVMGVLRPDEDGNVPPPPDCSEAIDDQCVSPLFRQIQTPDSCTFSEMSDMTVDTNEDDEHRHEGISDDHIAELISGEAEVLKEHNVIGVNFKKIIPKSGLFKSSEVFKHLNAEAVKTKSEKEKETKRWTTFMQKPDRPIPKSPAQLEQERRKKLAYRVQICKQPKPRCDPNRPPSPIAPPATAKVVEPEPVLTEPMAPQPDTVELIVEDNNSTENQKDCHGDNGCPNINVEQPCADDSPKDCNIDAATSGQVEEQPTPPVQRKSSEEVLLEKQLCDVQKQLLALSTLPMTIQATLDAVTKQLAELVPALQHQQQQLQQSGSVSVDGLALSSSLTEVDAVSTEAIADDQSTTRNLSEDATSIELNEIQLSEGAHPEQLDIDEIEKNADEDTGSVCSKELNEINCNVVESKEHELEVEEDEGLKAQEDIDKQRMEKCYRRQEEEWLTKREKIDKWNKIWSWTNETKNEMFRQRDHNCSVIASKIEASLVNFLKYKKPEKDLSNLDRSETFKIIHQTEREPRHGIQVRPPLVFSEEEVRVRSTPVSWV